MTSYSQVLIVVLPIIITALLGWISPYVVKFLDAHIGQANRKNLTEFAHTAVTAAEQQVKNGANSDKKDIALAALSAFAADNKYKVSASSLDALIEAAVYSLKQWNQPVTLSSAITPSGETVTVPAVPVVNVEVAAAAPAPAPDPASPDPVQTSVEVVPAPAAEAAPVDSTSNPGSTF